jgi:SAM-dependent methyltransferase
MTIDIEEKWSLFFERQHAFRRRYRSVWKVPLRRRHTDIVVARCRPGLSVLEVGASDRNIFGKISLAHLDINYLSCDRDRSLPHDFYSIDAVDRTFQQVWMFEVIEHVALEEGYRLLEKIFALLEPGGELILSTPNGHHPHRYREPHHKTPFKYDNLCALIEVAGFEVAELYRLYNAPFLEKIAHRFFLAGLHRFLELDFATTLAAVARKPVEPSR